MTLLGLSLYPPLAVASRSIEGSLLVVGITLALLLAIVVVSFLLHREREHKEEAVREEESKDFLCKNAEANGELVHRLAQAPSQPNECVQDYLGNRMTLWQAATDGLFSRQQVLDYIRAAKEERIARAMRNVMAAGLGAAFVVLLVGGLCLQAVYPVNSSSGGVSATPAALPGAAQPNVTAPSGTATPPPGLIMTPDSQPPASPPKPDSNPAAGANQSTNTVAQNAVQ
ncbi:MAG: hypothetical protein NTW87_11900 [Planctomycetota bacterium]|nr:hypothetical protein [Planctomycetota bacterium]